MPFAHWLMSEAKPGLFVELGVHTGVSYSAFCSAIVRQGLITRAFAVDTWKGDEHAGEYGEEVFRDFLAFHDARYRHFSSLLRTTFDEALNAFEDSSLDLLHIDGYHTYEAVKHDFESWFIKLSPQAIVLFHDTNIRDRQFGVWRFWAELSQQFPAFEFLHGAGLGVLAVGQNAPLSVLELCALREPQNLFRVRQRFAAAGERWHSEWESRTRIEATERSLHEVTASLAGVEAERQRIQSVSADLENALKTQGVLQKSLRTANDSLAQAHAELSAVRGEHTNIGRELWLEKERAAQLMEEIQAAKQREASLVKELHSAKKRAEQLTLGADNASQRAAQFADEAHNATKRAERLTAELHNTTIRAQNLADQLQDARRELGVHQERAARFEQEAGILRHTITEQQSVMTHVNSSTVWRWIVKYRTWIELHRSWAMIRFYDNSVRRLWRKTSAAT